MGYTVNLSQPWDRKRDGTEKRLGTEKGGDKQCEHNQTGPG
jgi:hypothetical protein